MRRGLRFVFILAMMSLPPTLAWTLEQLVGIESDFMAMMGLLPAVAWADAAPGAGIAGSKHDFSGKGGAGECTFCHTPHRGQQTLLLWNHKLSTNTFKWDVPTTTAGTPFPTFKGDTFKGPTAKCLSCHDGSVAIGDVAWWKGAPATLDTTTHGQGSRVSVGFGGNLAGNHPVAMPYPFNNQKSTYNNSTTGPAIVTTEFVTDPTTLNIRLFNDDGAGNITAGPVSAKSGIECTSCHDPHNKASKDQLFLRGSISGNTTDYICLKCHVK